MADQKKFILALYDVFGESGRLSTVLNDTFDLYQVAGGTFDDYLRKKYSCPVTNSFLFLSLRDDWKLAWDLIQHPALDRELFFQCFTKVLKNKEKEFQQCPQLGGLGLGIQQSKTLFTMLKEAWKEEPVSETKNNSTPTK